MKQSETHAGDSGSDGLVHSEVTAKSVQMKRLIPTDCDVDAVPRHCAILSFKFSCVQVSRYNMLSLIIPFPTLILWQKMNRTQLDVSVMLAYPLLHCKHGESVYLAGLHN